MNNVSNNDLAKAFIEQNSKSQQGFWAKQDSLRNRITRWLDEVEREAVDQSVAEGNEMLQDSHDLVNAIRSADVDELVVRIEAITNPQSVAEVQDPESLPDDVYAQWRQQGGMNPHPGGLGVGLFDPIENAAVSPRARGSRRVGLYGPPA